LDLNALGPGAVPYEADLIVGAKETFRNERDLSGVRIKRCKYNKISASLKTHESSKL
jgi:hypothetical protein